MAMSLTVSQMFLGAISIGIAMHRGTEVYTAFHHESLVAHANYASSKLSHDHCRSANVVVNNNVIMAAIMGPRFGVEADNLTLDANAALTCPQCPKGPLCKLCMQYKANKPRATAKQTWVRAMQKTVWGGFGEHSRKIDQLTSMESGGVIASDLQRSDSRVKVRIEDPSRSKDIWGGGNAGVACRLAMKDTLPSPVLGHAFPTLVSQNLLEGLPKALVQAMPEKICAATGGGGGGGGSGSGSGSGSAGTVQLPQIKEIADKTRDDCRELEKDMRCQIAAAKGGGGSCEDLAAPEISDLHDAKTPTFSSKVQPFVSCQTATPDAPLKDTYGGGYSYRNDNHQIVTCTFDRAKCEDKRLTENSNDYLRDKLGLPKIVSDLAASLGGSETRAPTENSTQDFCACTYTQREVDPLVVGISEASRKIATAGTSSQSEALRRQRDYRSCGKWYFPGGKGEFASTPKDEQPFVGAWKWALVKKCGGGS